MDKNARSYLAIGIGACVALLAVHVGEPARIPALVLLAGLLVWSLREPTAGLLAALPLVYMVHPTPTELSWREYGFAGVLAISGCAVLVRARRQVLPAVRDARVPALLAVVWLALNFATALRHGVTVPEWLRGVMPFLFLLYGVPVWLEARANHKFPRLWLFSMGLTAALFAWHVIQVYVDDALWKPNTYILEQGQWIQMGREEAGRLGKPVYEFALRVTLLVQQATCVLLPLGAIWGSWAMLCLPRPIERGLGLALAVLSTVAMVLTYTRSMLLAAGLVIGVLMLAAWRQGAPLRALALAGMLGASAGTTMFVFDLEPIYLNRIHTMVRQTTDIATPTTNPIDVNITSRIDEYKIAWRMFADSPLLGQGLGIKHDMRFEMTQGEFLEVRVGYVHNWVMYSLMVGGILGLIAYSAVLFAPVWLAWRHVADRQLTALVLATVAGTAIYGLFFAVFRLIPFNLVLGGLWALVLVRARPEPRN